MAKARILFVVCPFAWGGTEKHLEEVIARLDPSSIEPVIQAFGPHQYRQALSRLGRDDVIVETADAWPTFRGFRRVFAAHGPETIVFVKGQLDLFPWQAYAAARVSGASRVVVLEHLQAERPPAGVDGLGVTALLKRAVGWRARLMFRLRLPAYLAHVTVCVSEAVRRRLVDDYGFPEARTVVVLNGIDLNYYRHSGSSRAERRLELGINPDIPLLVCIARLARPKRLDRLVQAMSALRARRSSLRCVIVGDGMLEAELREQATALELGDALLFAGHQNDVRPYLEAADVYVITSDREGFGLALAEAMAFELPCVATNIGGHDEVLADPATGILVPPESQAEFVRAVEYLLDHPADARAMGRAARKAVAERFDIERMVRELVAVFLNRSTDQGAATPAIR